VMSAPGPSPVEAYIAERITPHIPFVSVSNPAAIPPGKAALPRLEIANDKWEFIVRLLLSAARFIVLETNVLAEGVTTELMLIQARQRETDTVVVLPGASSVDEIREGRQLANAMGFRGRVGPTADAVSGDEPIFDAFVRLVDEDTLLGSDPAATSAFDGLLGTKGSAE
jgi:hypothetical protein